MDFLPAMLGDGSAVSQFAGRKGRGRLKHVEQRLLVVQDRVAQWRLRHVRIDMVDNAADLLTKHVPRQVWEHLRPVIGVREGSSKPPVLGRSPRAQA